eukprot:CAMPEP_0194201352 /NCGR_PEP_ID=MMETSP0156-20130528/1640_1 /TAXON_ID=33649 /ORGANISM="Thalassionema nitzschioides, Strain L26-B" /LENGTH=91 /DNA_ID=CAMNT_0038926521 /DNA_START=99 /DNA_END=374 /DNA_ORIENTATION=-
MKLCVFSTLVALASSFSPLMTRQLRPTTSLTVSREEYFQPHFTYHEQQKQVDQNEQGNKKEMDPLARSNESPDILEYRLARLHEIAEFEEH